MRYRSTSRRQNGSYAPSSSKSPQQYQADALGVGPILLRAYQ